MKLLLKKTTIVDERLRGKSPTSDILIEDGMIREIGNGLSAGDAEVIDPEGLHVSIGWMDLRANFRDPGQEQKETLESGLAAAAAGGFTAVALSPDLQPASDNKAAIKYLLERSSRQPVEVFPLGALSRNLKGDLLAEMYDMYKAGAVAFTDDRHPVLKSGLMERALRYARNFGGLVMAFPYDASLAPAACVHEGLASVQMGMKGIPDIAEEIQVIRDLKLLDYSDGGRLHLGPLSAGASLRHLAEAKANGANISADVTAAHLYFTDEDLIHFEANLKVMPPFRTAADRGLLREAVAAGIIDVISSDHQPQDTEHKNVEFEQAAFGMAGIETFFPTVMAAMGQAMPLAKLIATFSLNPRKILGLPLPEIKPGQPANLTLFQPQLEYRLKPEDLHTAAVNVPFTGQTLRGKVFGIVREGQVVKNA